MSRRTLRDRAATRPRVEVAHPVAPLGSAAAVVRPQASGQVPVSAALQRDGRQVVNDRVLVNGPLQGDARTQGAGPVSATAPRAARTVAPVGMTEGRPPVELGDPSQGDVRLVASGQVLATGPTPVGVRTREVGLATAPAPKLVRTAVPAPTAAVLRPVVALRVVVAPAPTAGPPVDGPPHRVTVQPAGSGRGLVSAPTPVAARTPGAGPGTAAAPRTARTTAPTTAPHPPTAPQMPLALCAVVPPTVALPPIDGPVPVDLH